MCPLALHFAPALFLGLFAAGTGLRAPEEGRLVLESLAGQLETRAAAEPGDLRLAADATAFVRYEGPRPVRAEAPARLELSDGQRWCGNVAGGSGDTLRFGTSLGAEMKVGVDDVRRLEFTGRLSEVDRAALAPAADGDRLYWVRGTALERVDGAFEAFSDAGVVLTGVLGKRTFPWGEVGALFIATVGQGGGGAAAQRPADVPAVADLDDGSRLRGGFVGAGAGGLLFVSTTGTRLEIPFERLSEISIDDGSFAFLSDLAPTRVVEGSLFGDEFGLAWPHRVDRSVVGTPLLVAGRAYSRGLGVHAPSRLEWQLDAAPGTSKARELTGAVGIDDSVRATTARGSVRFQVEVDGAVRWDSGVVRGGEAPRALPRIDLRGAKVLTLAVLAAEDSFVADRADWLRLVLVREP